MKSRRPFLILWTLAVAASVAAFVLHLALRGCNVELGYDLGKARGEQARLREVKHVLELEAASYETPQRVEVVCDAVPANRTCSVWLNVLMGSVDNRPAYLMDGKSVPVPLDVL